MEEIQQTPSDSNSFFRSRGAVIATIVVIISLVSGAVGGSLGTLYLLRQPEIQRWYQNLPVTSGQKVVLEEENAVIDVVNKAGPAVVSIVVSKDISKTPGYGMAPFNQFFPFWNYSQQVPENTEPNIQKVGAGTGFFVTNDGLIITNRHVVADESASYSVVTSDDKTYEAKVLARDTVNDLALVKIDYNNPIKLNLADTSKLQVGQKVVAIGNSLGQYQNTVTSGIISGIGRSIVAGGGSDGIETLEGVIQTDAAINPGNSGGPLLNMLGEVIGINTAISEEGQLVGFAIPANDAKRALESYQANGRIVRPYLGVRYVLVTEELAKKEKLDRNYGALITRGDQPSESAVIAGGPADKAGLKENDIILEVDGKKVGVNDSLVQLLSTKKAGDTVNLKVFSGGQEKTVRVTLEERK